MPKCDRCGAFMDSAATACTWCGAGGDNGSAVSFVVPTGPAAPAAALAGVAAGQDGGVAAVSIDSLAIDQRNLKGIAGWLILVAINLALAPLGLLFAFASDLLLLKSGQIQVLLAAHPAVSGVLMFDAICDVVLLAAMIVLNVLFYGKKKTFPLWFIIFLAMNLILALGIHQAMLNYVPTYPSLAAFGSFVSACGWIAYFVLSKRVKQTFVN